LEQKLSRWNRIFFRIIGGAAVVATFFFGTLFATHQLDIKNRNAVRAAHARLLEAALERYRAAHGLYPALLDNPTSDLRSALVAEGFLINLPVDPLWPEKPYRYTSGANDGKSYGLLFNIEGSDNPTCVTGPAIIDPNWWHGPPKCPF
jgi:hypothetical protein